MNMDGSFDPSVEFTGPGGYQPRQVIQKEVAKAWDVEVYYAGILLDASEGAVGGNPSPNYVLGMEEIAGADPNVPFSPGPAPIPPPTEEVRGWPVNAEVDVEFVEIQLRTIPTAFGAGLGYGPAGAQIAMQLMNIGNVQYTIPLAAGVRDVYWDSAVSPNLAQNETHQTHQLTSALHFDPGDIMAFRIFEIAPGLNRSPGDMQLRIY
jgi:hypothetical protein